MRRWWSDARHFQIVALSSLLLVNFTWIDFGAKPLYSALAILSALATQAVCSRLAGLPNIDLRSPLITGLSLSLLLRADAPWLPAAGRRHRHRVQIHVPHRRQAHLESRRLRHRRPAVHATRRLDIAGPMGHRASGSRRCWSFSRSWCCRPRSARTSRCSSSAAMRALLVARAVWLGDPLAIPLHQLQSGSLLIFAFFMISDPRTAPDSRLGRFLFALSRRGAGALSRVLHANAAGALCGADRAVAAHAAARPDHSRRTIRMDLQPHRELLDDQTHCCLG